jgi:hypothetical protein
MVLSSFSFSHYKKELINMTANLDRIVVATVFATLFGVSQAQTTTEKYNQAHPTEVAEADLNKITRGKNLEDSPCYFTASMANPSDANYRTPGSWGVSTHSVLTIGAMCDLKSIHANIGRAQAQYSMGFPDWKKAIESPKTIEVLGGNLVARFRCTGKSTDVPFQVEGADYSTGPSAAYTGLVLVEGQLPIKALTMSKCQLIK